MAAKAILMNFAILLTAGTVSAFRTNFRDLEFSIANTALFVLLGVVPPCAVSALLFYGSRSLKDTGNHDHRF